jgi:amino acid efflux transporter
VGLLYFCVAFVTVGTEAWAAGGSVAPFAALLSRVFGVYGAAGTAILAVVIIFATVNAYMAGMSRVVLAVARDGALPGFFSAVSPRSGAPARSLILLTGLALLMLLVYYVFDFDLQTALLIPSGAAILVYVIGSAAGIKLLQYRGVMKAMPWISLVMSVAVLPFVGPLAAAGVIVGLAGFGYSLASRKHRAPAEAGGE